ncbi:MAG: GNAT family N-acetyltransferase [Microbacterium sp.]
MSEVHIRRVLATDGERVRALRLEALDDPAAGIAFLESRDDALARPRSFWDERAVGSALSGSAAQFIAEAGSAWVGTVTILIPEEGTPDYFGRLRPEGTALAVGVYVSPAHRGGEVVDDLFEVAAQWALDQGCTELVLDVHQDNARAQSAYARLGFAPTGGTIDGQNGRELEMARRLGHG